MVEIKDIDKHFLKEMEEEKNKNEYEEPKEHLLFYPQNLLYDINSRADDLIEKYRNEHCKGCERLKHCTDKFEYESVTKLFYKTINNRDSDGSRKLLKEKGDIFKAQVEYCTERLKELRNFIKNPSIKKLQKDPALQEYFVRQALIPSK